MKRIAVILCLLLSYSLGAIEGRFVNYSSADGLPSNSVYAIAQDADGFLWVGTRGGPCRFDGARFKVWKETGWVNAITVDRDNRLWVGTGEGLYVKQKDGFLEGPRGNMRALMTDSDGYVWAMVGDTTLLKLTYDAGICEKARCRYDKRDHEGDYPYFQIFEDSAGKLWPGGRLVRTQYIKDKEHPSVEYPSGDYVLGYGHYAEVHGILYVFDDPQSILYTYVDGAFIPGERLPVSHARLLTDHLGRLWAAGSYGLALVDMDAPADSPVYHPASDELYCIFEDSRGNLWVGGDNGLSVLCPEFQQVHDVSRDNVKAIMEDSRGKLWIGTAEERVSCLYEDSEGTVYVGLWNNTGFDIWKGDRRSHGKVSGPLPKEQDPAAWGDKSTSNWIADFLEDSKGRFWVVTWEGVGLNHWDRKTGRTLPDCWLSPFRYPSPQVDSNIYLSSRLGSRLIEDAKGNLVFATTQAGMNIIDKDTGLVTKYYRGNSSIPDDYVTDLCLTEDGIVWASTRGGIWSPSGKHFLDGTLVQSIEADAAGRLWAGTEEGLYFIDTDGHTGRAGKGLGFPSDIYGEKVSCALADGSLAFGGASGAVVFHPDSLLALADKQEILLSDFLLSDTGLSFAFSVKDIPLASLLRYRYKLSGVDKDWINVDYPRLEGRYNSLFPRRYTLEIQCTDIFGRWQEAPFAKSFRVRPALLLRWPFLLLYLLVFAGALWLFVKYRENLQRTLVLQEELDTRNQFFDIVSHDLRNPVSGIKTLSESLRDASEEHLKEGIKAIGSAAERTSALLENILMWSVSQKDVLKPVMREEDLAEIVQNIIEDKPVVTRIPEGLTVITDRNMLTTCLRNLIDNAVKFSPPGGKVLLDAGEDHISIIDSGPGMDEKTLRSLSKPGHLGLVITTALLEKIGASLSARNLPEGGCEVTIHL